MSDVTIILLEVICAIPVIAGLFLLFSKRTPKEEMNIIDKVLGKK